MFRPKHVNTSYIISSEPIPKLEGSLLVILSKLELLQFAGISVNVAYELMT